MVRALVLRYEQIEQDVTTPMQGNMTVTMFLCDSDTGSCQQVGLVVKFNWGDVASLINAAISDAVISLAAEYGYTLSGNDVLMQNFSKG